MILEILDLLGTMARDGLVIVACTVYLLKQLAERRTAGGKA